MSDNTRGETLIPDTLCLTCRKRVDHGAAIKFAGDQTVYSICEQHFTQLAGLKLPMNYEAAEFPDPMGQ